MGFTLLILVVLLLVAVLPNWEHSRNWGYIPSGVAALLFVGVAALAFFNVISWSF